MKAPPVYIGLTYAVDLGLLFFLVSKTKKCWDQELVHLLAAEASSQANGSSQAVLGPKHGLLGLLLLLSVAGWHFFFALLLCLRLIVKNPPPGAAEMRLDCTLLRIIFLQHWLMTFDAFLISKLQEFGGTLPWNYCSTIKMLAKVT